MGALPRRCFGEAGRCECRPFDRVIVVKLTKFSSRRRSILTSNPSLASLPPRSPYVNPFPPLRSSPNCSTSFSPYHPSPQSFLFPRSHTSRLTCRYSPSSYLLLCQSRDSSHRADSPPSWARRTFWPTSRPSASLAECCSDTALGEHQHGSRLLAPYSVKSARDGAGGPKAWWRTQMRMYQ